jgi:hypothetical protein
MPARESDTKTTISGDGLRYTARVPGSQFGPVALGGRLTMMSCFKCGRHKPMSALATKRILGRNEKVCAQGCRSDK